MPKRTRSSGSTTGSAPKAVRPNGASKRARYSKSLTRAICERIAKGEVWYRIANTGRMPSYTALYDWLRKYPDFAEDYALAREMAADLRADKALMVAEASTPATVQSDRLRVGALQWRAAKAAPHRYGARAGDADVLEEGPPRRLVIEVKHFEKVTRPDGSVYVREIPRARPEDEGRR